ncbi:hypothetical protein HX109_14965 [Galbibacter sp. BG1]|uniref:HYC_CC_PP family protein n=1 Tax=Galbibacter sp. BG1 TaxID=1170699 RepID=UPI0015B9CC51|nr:hypothetical protein [Galbibacter sp. BG1]QLE02803.1 hypothetical protein HX109_14965 [Galbibacter sp. BG1]
MKIFFSKIVSCLMALVVLLSTTSFTVDMHYCGNDLVDVALLKPAENCGMEMQDSSSDEEKVAKSNCCTDEHIVVEGQKELKSSFEKLTFHQQTILVSYVLTSLNLFEGLQQNIVPFKDYIPPILVSEIQLENQTFLI